LLPRKLRVHHAASGAGFGDAFDVFDAVDEATVTFRRPVAQLAVAVTGKRSPLEKNSVTTTVLIENRTPLSLEMMNPCHLLRVAAGVG
jgi:hypothetical protein